MLKWILGVAILVFLGWVIEKGFEKPESLDDLRD